MTKLKKLKKKMQLRSIDEYVTISKAAEITNLTRQRIHFLLKQGRFPNAVRVGKIWLIPYDDVEEFQKSRSPYYLYHHTRMKKETEE